MIVVLESSYPLAVDTIVTEHLRVQPSDEELYTSAVRCVQNAIDIAADYCNRIIARSKVVMSMTVGDGVAMLPTAPIVEVESVEVNGNAVDHQLIGNDKVAYISHIPSGEATIVATVGYEELPGSIYAAVVMMAHSLFEGNSEGALSSHAKSLLNPYRIYPYGV